MKEPGKVLDSKTRTENQTGTKKLEPLSYTYQPVTNLCQQMIQYQLMKDLTFLDSLLECPRKPGGWGQGDSDNVQI